uniref:ATP synthase F0 subunit 8 n=1 Tax=Metacrangonyx goulmimensis TaxID=1199162 RepID=K7ZVV2_9CRUS|nr:ATP synthase F0 subunit 8 [Metacrangonyx goulmimensis]
MPQMAPSLWLIIYLFVWVMTYSLGNMMFYSTTDFPSSKKTTFSSEMMSILWQ